MNLDCLLASLLCRRSCRYNKGLRTVRDTLSCMKWNV